MGSSPPNLNLSLRNRELQLLISHLLYSGGGRTQHPYCWSVHFESCLSNLSGAVIKPWLSPGLLTAHSVLLRFSLQGRDCKMRGFDAWTLEPTAWAQTLPLHLPTLQPGATILHTWSLTSPVCKRQGICGALAGLGEEVAAATAQLCHLKLPRCF